MDTSKALVQYLLRLGDDQLVLGHQLSLWCGHAPILEEDIALANIALDCLGQAQHLLALAAKEEGAGRTADDLAYFRDEVAFCNSQLVERPNGDFAVTITRQFLFEAYAFELFRQLSNSSHAELAAIAARSVKESRYHLRHCRQWVLRLGDGTQESHDRMTTALEALWPHTSELFMMDAIHLHLVEQGIAPDLNALQVNWHELVTRVLTEATLTVPPMAPTPIYSARDGFHSEHLGHMLAEMQSVARAHPGVQW